MKDFLRHVFIPVVYTACLSMVVAAVYVPMPFWLSVSMLVVSAPVSFGAMVYSAGIPSWEPRERTTMVLAEAQRQVRVIVRLARQHPGLPFIVDAVVAAEADLGELRRLDADYLAEDDRDVRGDVYREMGRRAEAIERLLRTLKRAVEAEARAADPGVLDRAARLEVAREHRPVSADVADLLGDGEGRERWRRSGE